MSKSHIEELREVYGHLLLDAADAYPTLQASFERDLETLESLILHRGLHACCVDLPAAGRHLDKCLDRGEYKHSGLPTTSRLSKWVVIPKLFQGLYLLIFDKGGRLKEDCDVQAIKILRQLLYVGKRVDVACSRDKVIEAILDFITADNVIGTPDHPEWIDVSTENHPGIRATNFLTSPFYFGEVLRLAREKVAQEESLPEYHLNVAPIPERMWIHHLQGLLRYVDSVSTYVSSALGHYDREDWSFKHGPGAIAQTSKISNKFQWWNWSEELDSAFPIADCGFHNYCSWAGSVYLHPKENPPWVDQAGGTIRRHVGSEVPISRMIDVPKDYTKPRLIAAEPSEHMWCQQNIWHYFCTKTAQSWLSRFLNFRDQTQNQELCRKGSMGGDLATVDLSAASDSVTCQAVGCMFRGQPDLLHALAATRTRIVDLKSYLPACMEMETFLFRQGLEGQTSERYVAIKKLIANNGYWNLNKFSTMGNACTFPVESILFLTIAIAATLYSRGLPVNRGTIDGLQDEVSIFGDDLIVPSESRKELYTLLDLLGFKVNDKKSYWGENFRESCGLDAFRGVNVTPIYWKRPWGSGPESAAGCLATRNHFYKNWYLRTAEYLYSTRPRAKNLNFAAVQPETGVTGCVTWNAETAAIYNANAFKMRWNGQYMCTEILIPSFVTKGEKEAICDDSAVLQYFTENPSPFIEWASGVPQRPAMKLQSRWARTDDYPVLLEKVGRVVLGAVQSRAIAGSHFGIS